MFTLIIYEVQLAFKIINLIRSCQILSMTLLELGFQSLSLHSMMSQRERIATLTKFRSNTVKILVATDVASRGELIFFHFINNSVLINFFQLKIYLRT